MTRGRNWKFSTADMAQREAWDDYLMTLIQSPVRGSPRG
jgi:polyphosphate kinase 2 (PPK2 family)